MIQRLNSVCHNPMLVMAKGYIESRPEGAITWEPRATHWRESKLTAVRGQAGD